MIVVLDTNVLSELMRAAPDARVAAWLDGQDERSLFTTAVSQAEILAGLALLADGRRRRDLEAAATAMFLQDLGDRVLPFDGSATVHYAPIFAHRRWSGRPIGMADAMIAAIARVHGAALATRNTRDFEGCEIRLIDPWRPGGDPAP